MTTPASSPFRVHCRAPAPPEKMATAGGPGLFRCPCHNLMFATRAELRHHMSACPLTTLGVANYQTWLDKLDTTAPLPKLLPRTRVSRINELTEATKARLDASQTARAAPGALDGSTRISQHPRTSRRNRGLASSNWAAVFASTPSVRRYLTYLLSYGSVMQADEYQPQELTREVHTDLAALFQCLDRGHSGRIDIEDLCHAAEDAFGTEYNTKNYGRVDKSRAGSLDFVAVMRLFFPQHGSKKLAQMHEKFLKPAERVRTTREQMSVADAAAIDKAYDAIMKRRGGCTLSNLVASMTTYTKEHQSDFAGLFAAHDGDGDGVLTREEFMELVKVNYPPFREDRRRAWGHHRGGDGDDDDSVDTFNPSDYDHWLSKDKRLYLPRLPDMKVRPYGQTELASAKRQGGVRQERIVFHERAKQLHLTNPAVKKFAMNATLER